MKITSAVETANSTRRTIMPSPAEMPPIPEAMPTENGFTTEDRQPICVPSTTMRMAVTVSSPSASMTGTNMRKYTMPSS